jgi:hypothetical protein
MITGAEAPILGYSPNDFDICDRNYKRITTNVRQRKSTPYIKSLVQEHSC